ncbi:transposase [Clostridium ganghwense]|uniref:Transposase n=1 Tax=Clostridium ganghwense TaxID=312089 RepID=A0ABT4CPG6_9CLOT|nr:transposase [Clostridium ganghwense]MCY6370943.1 transposase [Clostridium ganghwense]
MPRTARLKSTTAIYHVMMRSISDFNLFRDNKDKDKYLKLLKKYKGIHMFKLYAFCLMDTHAHLLIDSNGADISGFMHNINQCYAQYYNKKYHRTGHVFGDRFKSKIATNDVSIMCMSAYIHNNPKDIKGYKNCVENYKYSSFGIYLGKQNNILNIVDSQFIVNHFNSDPILATNRYFKFVKSRTNENIDNLSIEELEFKNIPTNYKSYVKPITRTFTPKEIIKYVADSYNFNETDIHLKYNHKSSTYRALCVLLMHNLCDLKLSKISNILGNISLSTVSQLCYKGYKLIHEDCTYQDIIINFLKYKTA